MPLYDRIRAVNYATTFALNYNPMWADDRTVRGGGGDCTNFISQILYYAGWEMVRGAKIDPTAWYEEPFDFVRSERSWTWAGAAPFSKFLRRSGRGLECSYDDLLMGDLIQETYMGDVSHTMIVTKVIQHGGTKSVFLSYHSHDQLNKKFDDIKKAAGLDANFIFWKLRDYYTSTTDLITARGMEG